MRWFDSKDPDFNLIFFLFFFVLIMIIFVKNLTGL